eukprot:gnl/TRDRNA2_/TRDRNA2_180027_c0_seq1.p1 gnl/TRDRNA2_/TRDRNA2_180027_c0~~gnl/TRDRNA2_/TRDRNA2_180027_c0_seq1.p1  ORF type:complete len:281 (-),score=58.17 gnl/TRDRNA2_/TRDRNA2_180027_c0_seq1:246-1088(-)
MAFERRPVFPGMMPCCLLFSLGVCLAAAECDDGGADDVISLLSIKRLQKDGGHQRNRKAGTWNTAETNADIAELLNSGQPMMKLSLQEMLSTPSRQTLKAWEEEMDTSVGNSAFLWTGPIAFNVYGMEMRPFAMALYLDKKSPLWHRNNTVADVLSNGEGLTIVLRTAQKIPKVMPMSAVTAFVKMFLGDYVASIPGCNRKDLATLLELSSKEGHTDVNDDTRVSIDDDGLLVDIKGKKQGRLDNVSMAQMLLFLFISEKGPMPGSSKEILRRLQHGWKA